MSTSISARDDGTQTYETHEVVGMFLNESDLNAAIDELQINGFDRNQISVLGTEQAITAVNRMEDDGQVSQTGFASSDSRLELEAAAIGLPIYVVGVGSLFAVIASGGSLAMAIGALFLGGAAGGGVGGVVAHAIAEKHRRKVNKQLAEGGTLIWVQIRSDEQESKAIRILQQKGTNVHVHKIAREWGIKNIPFHDLQPDPFLERDEPHGDADDRGRKSPRGAK